LPRSAFARDQIAGNTRWSHVIRYKPDCNHLHMWSGTSLIAIIYIAGLSHLLTQHFDCD